MGTFHFGNAFEIEAGDVTFGVWDTCPNYDSNGATHLFNIETLRKRSADEIRSAVSTLGL